MSISGMFGGENLESMLRSEFYNVGSDSREDKLGAPFQRLPLFSRCPITNEARLENPGEFLDNRSNRIPLNSISNVPLNIDPGRILNGLPTGFTMAQQAATNSSNQRSIDFNNPNIVQANNNRLKPLRSPIHKPSLDEVKDNSLVALTNKFGKGKYWFKSASPTPDPRWSAEQQLMIGPIPGDVEYSQLRAAFLAQGHTLHLFIQNNQGWLEKNQEKFGSKHVKFGYVVYTERETARRLLSNGYVPVGSVKISVKEMDGQPAVFL